jgi:antitoxin VapB
MALNIKSGEVVDKIRRLAREQHVDLTQAVNLAVSHELERVEDRKKARLRRMRAIADRAVSLPILDDRSADEILGYDEHGLPK